jgi:transposase-like protein
MPSLVITREELARLYFAEMQSTTQIARKYGVTNKTVWKRMQKEGMHCRPQKLSHKRLPADVRRQSVRNASARWRVRNPNYARERRARQKQKLGSD